MPEINKDDLPDEVKSLLAEKDAEIAALKEQAAKAPETQSEDDVEKAALAKADPTLRKIIEKAQQEAREAKAVAEIEKQARLDREMLSKASSLQHIAGTDADKATVLKEVYGVSTDLGQRVEQILKAANAQIDQSAMFSSVGKSGAETTISKEVESRVAEMIKANPNMTREMAEAQVYANDNDLYLRVQSGKDA